MATTAKKTAPKEQAPQTETAALPKVEPVETATKIGQDAVDTAMKTSSEITKMGVEKAVAMSQDQVAAAVKASSDAYKGYEEMIAFQRSNLDAFVKSGDIFTKGLKEFNSTVYKFAQSNIEESVSYAQKLMGCKSMVEYVELQNEMVKKQYETGIAESRKLSDISVKVAEQVSKPLADRVTGI